MYLDRDRRRSLHVDKIGPMKSKPFRDINQWCLRMGVVNKHRRSKSRTLQLKKFKNLIIFDASKIYRIYNGQSCSHRSLHIIKWNNLIYKISCHFEVIHGNANLSVPEQVVYHGFIRASSLETAVCCRWRGGWSLPWNSLWLRQLNLDAGLKLSGGKRGNSSHVCHKHRLKILHTESAALSVQFTSYSQTWQRTEVLVGCFDYLGLINLNMARGVVTALALKSQLSYKYVFHTDIALLQHGISLLWTK